MTLREKIQKARDTICDDPHLANFMIRDLLELKEVNLNELAWAYHQDSGSGPTKEEITSLLDDFEKSYFGDENNVVN